MVFCKFIKGNLVIIVPGRGGPGRGGAGRGRYNRY